MEPYRNRDDELKEKLKFVRLQLETVRGMRERSMSSSSLNVSAPAFDLISNTQGINRLNYISYSQKTITLTFTLFYFLSFFFQTRAYYLILIFKWKLIEFNDQTSRVDTSHPLHPPQPLRTNLHLIKKHLGSTFNLFFHFSNNPPSYKKPLHPGLTRASCIWFLPLEFNLVLVCNSTIFKCTELSKNTFFA